ncbi:MAG: type I-C CRISPR-associated protein Cas8c/Csd1, partial [bacterium]|nr:type I-C CRISPR-associated protein Cas8c/Csd1 [bacterium]
MESKPGFKTKQTKWTILLSRQGKFVHLLKEERAYPQCPHLEQGELIAGGQKRSHFLLDNLAVVSAYMESDKQTQHSDKRQAIEDKHRYFLQLLEQAASSEPLLKVCADFLKNKTELAKLHESIITMKAKGTDSTAFRVDDCYVLELSTWHKWWQQYRSTLRQERKEVGQTMLCLMTGEEVTPLPTHSKITGLTSVGGQASGTVLIGFDKESFASYSLSQSFNAACSQEAAATYRDTLDQLIKQAPRPLAGTMF